MSDVHVWRVELSRLGPRLPRLWDCLAADERVRAERFHRVRDRDRFVAGRGALRVLLASYCDTRPELLRFGYGPQGKPGLADAESPLRFNVAHSGDLAIIAVAHGREVGVDIERVPPAVRWSRRGV